MPTEPIRELVMRDIKSALELIVEGDSYFNTVARVSRVLEQQTHNELTLYVWSPSDATVNLDNKGTTTGIIETNMNVNIVALFAREVASDTFAMRLAADVERAVMADRDRGNYAVNTYLIGREIVTRETEPVAELTIKLVVRYRTDIANPSTQR